MVLTKQAAFDQILDELKSTSREINSVAVVSPDGMIIAGVFNDPARKMESAAAMAALIVGLGSKVSTVMEAGEMEEIILRSSHDMILVFTIADRAALIMQAGNEAILGQLLLRARRAIPGLAKLL